MKITKPITAHWSAVLRGGRDRIKRFCQQSFPNCCGIQLPTKWLLNKDKERGGISATLWPLILSYLGDWALNKTYPRADLMRLAFSSFQILAVQPVSVERHQEAIFHLQHSLSVIDRCHNFKKRLF